VAEPLGRYLSWSEREEIAALDHAGHGVRGIARRLGRDPSTISRELARGATRRGYRASVGQTKADRARAEPRDAKLATNLRLRREVQERLEQRESPEQIAGRLKIDFPDDLEMRVSAETIYQSLYVQSRGGLKRELTRYLRTGRSMRKPRRREGERRGRIPDMVMISERPPEVEDRAVPGHWEGDLIMGSAASNSAVGTLVERTTGFVMLLHLPDGHGALAVQEALLAKIATLPEQLTLSLTWARERRWPTTPRSPRSVACRSTSATRTHPGNAARTRTPTGSCASTCPRAPTSASTALDFSTTSPPN
jgi:IS30 family transposase